MQCHGSFDQCNPILCSATDIDSHQGGQSAGKSLGGGDMRRVRVCEQWISSDVSIVGSRE